MLIFLLPFFHDFVIATGESSVLAGMRAAIGESHVNLLADAAGPLERNLHIKPPQSLSSKLKSKLFFKPIETIKTYPAQSFFMDNYEVRLSEEFKMLHFDGITPEIYQKPILFGKFGQILIKVPEDLKNWKYGEKRRLATSNSVKLTEFSRESKNGPWSGGTEVEKELVFEATRYEGRKLGNGKLGNDIFVIESIVDHISPTKNKFKKGAISGLVIKEQPVTYGGVPTWSIPTAFTTLGNTEIRGTESFINNHVLGNPMSDYNPEYLFVFPVQSGQVNLDDSDIAKLEFNELGVIQTPTKSIDFGYAKDGLRNTYTLTKLYPHGLKFAAIKYRNPNTGLPVVVLTGIEGYVS